VFGLFRDGECVRQYECYDEESVDFVEKFGLDSVSGRLRDGMEGDVLRHRSQA
jgi:hypothetical protein